MEVAHSYLATQEHEHAAALREDGAGEAPVGAERGVDEAPVGDEAFPEPLPDEVDIYCSYAKYDAYKSDVAGHVKPVFYNGKQVGELKALNSWSEYSVAMRCQIAGHKQCTRMRTWRPNSGEPIVHVDRVLIEWLLAECDPVACRNGKTDHMDARRSPVNRACRKRV